MSLIKLGVETVRVTCDSMLLDIFSTHFLSICVLICNLYYLVTGQFVGLESPVCKRH
jgi:hypothetical protein